MRQEILDYLQKIRPTKIGMLLLAGLILIIPFLIDLLLRTADNRIMQKLSLTLFTIRGFMLIFLAVFVYHLVFFTVSLILKKVGNKN